MPLRIEPHAEPIPGYRLIERLGGGGFGEVWKAEAPGGLYKAIKFVYGEISSPGGAARAPASGSESVSVSYGESDDNSRADQEFKALSRVKTVHHPYILSLERYDIIESQLVIVMELADRTLWDRFKECRSQGMPGIPRDELLRYMAETAEALDLMNNLFQLQHLDIKPQNLFLVFNHVKVADFGLVKDLGSQGSATITGGVTPVYAAPETFDGWLSRFSDQYSLAIVYQELLTGVRPFSGNSMRQLVMQHIQGKPDLTALPAGDQPSIARALAKDPNERHATCTEFVERLMAAAKPKILAAVKADLTGDFPAPQQTSITAAINQPRADGCSLRAAADSQDASEAEDPHYSDRPQVLPSRPSKKPPTLPEIDLAAPVIDQECPKTSLLARSKEGRAAEASNGTVQPALLIGLGQLGAETLAAFRRRVREEFGEADAFSAIRLLAIDTDADTIQALSQDPEVGLPGSAMINARLQRPTHYIKSAKGSTDTWLNPKLIYRIPKEGHQAGLRALGRLAFFDHFRAISKRLEAEIQACVAQDTTLEAEPRVDLGLRSHLPRIYVITSLAGTTGSGMFLDVTYLVRHLLRRQGLGQAEIVGIFYAPEADKGAAQSVALANTYAALVELNHFSSPQSRFQARYAGDESAKHVEVAESGPAFRRQLLFTLPRAVESQEAAANRDIVAQAGEFLFRETVTPIGQALDDLHRQQLPSQETAFRSVGMYRVTWPRRRLLERCAQRLCLRTVERWMTKDARPIAARVQAWAKEQWDSFQVRPDDLVSKIQESFDAAMRNQGGRYLNQLVEPLEALSRTAQPGQPLPAGSLIEALENIDAALGMPEANRPPNQAQAEPTPVETALAEVALKIGDEIEQRVAEAVCRLIEDPAFRLAGAEEALRQFGKGVDQALQSQEPLTAELGDRAAALHLKICERFSKPPTLPETHTPSSGWSAKFTRRTPPASNPLAELTDLYRTYVKVRHQSLVLQALTRVYVGLRGVISDQIREVGFCRQRLSELAGLFKVAAAPSEAAPRTRLLLPARCPTVHEAADFVDQGLQAQDLEDFDQALQGLIRQNYRALVNLCMGSSSMVKTIAPQMLREGELFLSPRLQGASVAQMFLSELGEPQRQSSESVAAALRSVMEQAALGAEAAAHSPCLLLAAIPDDEPGRQLQQALRDAMPEAHVLALKHCDELVFYQERQSVPLSALAQARDVAQESYRRRFAQDPLSLHCREDISAWRPLQPTPV